jgi:hypothetical protein
MLLTRSWELVCLFDFISSTIRFFIYGLGASEQCPTLIVNLTFDSRYFPALLLGGTFTPFELSAGAGIATLAVVAVLVFCLEHFRPVLVFLDRIPLVVYVVGFALMMSVDVLFELSEERAGAEAVQLNV